MTQKSTTNIWDVYDTVVPLVKRVMVAHPAEVKQIANSRVKTDNQAIVAIARKLLVTLWYLLSKQTAYTASSDEELAYKMLTWACHMEKSALRSMTNQQFAKYGLLQLGRGEHLTRIVKGGRPRRIAPSEQVLALKPNLQAPRSCHCYSSVLLIGRRFST